MTDPQTSSAPGKSGHAQQPPTRNRLVPWLIGLPVGIFGVLMLVGSLMDDPESKQRWVEGETIKLCWKQIQKPEAERKTHEFSSQADCEWLELAYKSRYQANP